MDCAVRMALKGLFLNLLEIIFFSDVWGGTHTQFCGDFFDNEDLFGSLGLENLLFFHSLHARLRCWIKAVGWRFKSRVFFLSAWPNRAKRFSDTLLKFNSSPLKIGLAPKDSSLPTIIFSGAMLNFGGDMICEILSCVTSTGLNIYGWMLDFFFETCGNCRYQSFLGDVPYMCIMNQDRCDLWWPLQLTWCSSVQGGCEGPLWQSFPKDRIFQIYLVTYMYIFYIELIV